MTHPPETYGVSAHLRFRDIIIDHNTERLRLLSYGRDARPCRSTDYFGFRRAKHTFLCYQRAIDEEFLE